MSAVLDDDERRNGRRIGRMSAPGAPPSLSFLICLPPPRLGCLLTEIMKLFPFVCCFYRSLLLMLFYLLLLLLFFFLVDNSSNFLTRAVRNFLMPSILRYSFLFLLFFWVCVCQQFNLSLAPRNATLFILLSTLEYKKEHPKSIC